MDYTEVAIAASVEQYAAGSVARPEGLAAVEAAASHVRKSAFSAARSVPDLPALNPQLLGLMGRAYVLRGEAVFMIAVDDAGLALVPASSWDVAGPADPRAWRYQVDLPAPWRHHVARRASRGRHSCSLALRSWIALARALTIEACAPFGRGRGGGGSFHEKRAGH